MMKLSLTMFHFLFQRFMLKKLWEKIKNTVGAISKHCGSDFKTLWERFKNTVGAHNRSLSVL
jgi:hypothetical protein